MQAPLAIVSVEEGGQIESRNRMEFIMLLHCENSKIITDMHFPMSVVLLHSIKLNRFGNIQNEVLSPRFETKVKSNKYKVILHVPQSCNLV